MRAQGGPGPAERARFIEAQLAALQSVGAPEIAIAALRDEAAALREQARRERPYGARLGSASSKLRGAEAKLQATAARLSKELDMHAKLKLEAQQAKAEWQQIHTEAPPAMVDDPDCVLTMRLAQAAFGVLGWLESHPWGQPGAGPPPDAMLEVMASLREAATQWFPRPQDRSCSARPTPTCRRRRAATARRRPSRAHCLCRGRTRRRSPGRPGAQSCRLGRWTRKRTTATTSSKA